MSVTVLSVKSHWQPEGQQQEGTLFFGIERSVPLGPCQTRSGSRPGLGCQRDLFVITSTDLSHKNTSNIPRGISVARFTPSDNKRFVSHEFCYCDLSFAVISAVCTLQLGRQPSSDVACRCLAAQQLASVVSWSQPTYPVLAFLAFTVKDHILKILISLFSPRHVRCTLQQACCFGLCIGFLSGLLTFIIIQWSSG